jgi:transcription antitermination factor NusG
MGENVFWYVLFVKTGSEETVAGLIRNNFDGDRLFPFVPQKTHVFRRKGNKTEFRKICFPGYVFIESPLEAKELLAAMFPVLYGINNAYRFLNYGDKRDIAMRGDEREALHAVIGDGHCIDISAGYKEGDSVRVVSGSLAGNESKIIRINKNRQNVVLALKMFGGAAEVSVGFEFIEKI